MRCPYCHNRELVENKGKEIPEEYIIKTLLLRKEFINSVVISGGEPTIHKDLPEFIKKGTRMLTRLKSASFAFRAMGALSQNGTPIYRALHERVQDWSARFEKRDVRTVELISYRRTSSGAYRPEITPYLSRANEPESSPPPPFEIEPAPEGSTRDRESAEGSEKPKNSGWLPLIEGDPERIAEELSLDRKSVV